MSFVKKFQQSFARVTAQFLVAASVLMVSVLTTHLSAQTVRAGLTLGSGEYTNLCGTGTDASAATCGGGCDPGSGTCSSGVDGVVRYTCGGRVTECRSGESAFGTSQSVGTGCGTTSQVDVFKRNCRDAQGNWICVAEDLVDYMVYYGGDCEVGTNPTPTPHPSQDPTPTPGPQCISSSVWNATTRQPISGELKVGDQLSIQCGIVPGAASYRFRYIHLVNGQPKVKNLVSSPQIADGNFSEPFAIPLPGTYVTQCSPCSEAGGKNCQAYEDPKKYALSKGLVVIDADGSFRDLPGGITEEELSNGGGTDSGGSTDTPDAVQIQLWNATTRKQTTSLNVGDGASIRCMVSAASYKFRAFEPDRTELALAVETSVGGGQFSKPATIRKQGLHVGQCAPCSDANGQNCSGFTNPLTVVDPTTTTNGASGTTVWWYSE